MAEKPSELEFSLEPLASRMRPKNLEFFFGQKHLLAKNKPLRMAIEQGKLHSMILWGPPGSGKTTLARLMAEYANARFEALSAVFSGVKDVRAAIAEAKKAKQQGHATILFIDEIHRFNKAQQDAFLPYVEDGTITLIGATTENPSFEVIGSLLSRTRVYVLKRLSIEEILQTIHYALKDEPHGLGKLKIKISEKDLHLIAEASDGDARRALNFLEIIADLAEQKDGKIVVNENIVKEVITGSQVRRFDKYGDIFYEQISALHKSVRGSDPDASLYWLARMLDGGCDPLYIARRVVRMANEDIGTADLNALTLALNAWDVQDRLGSPEGELALAQAVVYLACAPKSNAVYEGFNQAMADIKHFGTLEVPIHLRNAPTVLMKQLGYGKAYRYPHDEPEGYAAGETYFPEGMPKRTYYRPVARGVEIKIAERLKYLRGLDQEQKKS